jgi:hypothetical protein
MNLFESILLIISLIENAKMTRMWKVNYLLRPAKQISRKIIIETLNKLRCKWYDFSKYTYIGMPSITYYDFILFYKYLYIESMIWFESRDIKKRINFNKPYDFIMMKYKNFSDWYKKEHFKKKTILWLDYEKHIDWDKLRDISDVAWNYMKPWSIIIVSTPCMCADLVDIKKLKVKLDSLWSHLIFDKEIPSISEVTSWNLYKLYYRAIQSATIEWISYSRSYDICPIFNLIYADSSTWKMLCTWFIIDLPEKIGEVKNFINNSNCIFHNKIENWYHIEVPDNLTTKERDLFELREKEIKEELSKRWRKLKNVINLEIENKDFENYMKNHKYFPSYYEWII